MTAGHGLLEEAAPTKTDDTGQPGTPGAGDYVIHSVSWWEYLLGDVLRLKIPRALCGVLLIGDPDEPDLRDIGAPRCPRCIEIEASR